MTSATSIACVLMPALQRCNRLLTVTSCHEGNCACLSCKHKVKRAICATHSLAVEDLLLSVISKLMRNPVTPTGTALNNVHLTLPPVSTCEQFACLSLEGGTCDTCYFTKQSACKRWSPVSQYRLKFASDSTGPSARIAPVSRGHRHIVELLRSLYLQPARGPVIGLHLSARSSF